jgi:hypothetical protein
MYRHHQTYALAQETKFLVEDSGLCDLVDGLTCDYTTSHAQGVVRRFDDLMRFHFTERNRNNLGLEFTFTDLFGTENYYRALNQFIDSITHGCYVEKEAAGRYSKTLYPSEIAGQINSIPKYFSDREMLLAACRELIGALFDKQAITAERTCWVEKTPSNLLKISFLKELYPDAIFIHIKRDPRSVVYSLLKQSWAPDNISDAANFMRGTYEKWLKLRDDLAPSALNNYHEVKLEDFISSPDSFLNSLARKCGLSPYQSEGLSLVKASIESYMGGDLNNIDLIDKKLNAWKFNLPKEETDRLNEMYEDIVNAMGYGASGKSWLNKLSGLIR